MKTTPVAWVRRHPDGSLTNELLSDVSIDTTRRRSAAWLPLYLGNGVTRGPLFAHPDPDLDDRDAAMTHAYDEGRADEREEVRAEVLREMLEWEGEYMQQARGGDRSGHSDARASAAREIHDHLRSSWDTRDKMEAP